MAASSLRHHMERSHGIVLTRVREVEVGGGGPETYKVSFPRILKLVECPMEGCPARGKNSRINAGSQRCHRAGGPGTVTVVCPMGGAHAVSQDF